MNPAERAVAAAWSGLSDCRTDLMAARIWAMEAQIRLREAGSAHAQRASELSEMIAGCLEHCETAILHLQSDGREGSER